MDRTTAVSLTELRPASYPMSPPGPEADRMYGYVLTVDLGGRLGFFGSGVSGTAGFRVAPLDYMKTGLSISWCMDIGAGLTDVSTKNPQWTKGIAKSFVQRGINISAGVSAVAEDEEMISAQHVAGAELGPLNVACTPDGKFSSASLSYPLSLGAGYFERECQVITITGETYSETVSKKLEPIAEILTAVVIEMLRSNGVPTPP